MNQKILPTYYYLEHFTRMLRGVKSYYLPLLQLQDRAFFQEFSSLSKDAQCVYVRMNNRVGVIFSPHSFAYPEINDVNGALEELTEKEFIEPLTEHYFEEYAYSLTKATLIELCVKLSISIRSQMTKSEIAENLIGLSSVEEVYRCKREMSIDSDQYFPQAFRQGKSKTVSLFTYLYFGSISGSLQQVVLRDLGVRKAYDLDRVSRRFLNSTDAYDCFFYRFYAHQVQRWKTRRKGVLFNQYNSALSERHFCALSKRIKSKRLRENQLIHTERDSLVELLGEVLEANQMNDEALALYKSTLLPKSTVRRIKLLSRLKKLDHLKALLEKVMEDPYCDDEAVFAEDLYARKFGQRRLSKSTMLLRRGTTVEIDELYRTNPERGCLRLLKSPTYGYKVWKTENHIWNAMFGLLFWRELYGAHHQLASEYERVPLVLKDNSFYQRFSEVIETHVTSICKGSSTEVFSIIAESYQQFRGTQNGLFRWNRVNLESIESLFTYSKPRSLGKWLRRMTKDYMRCRDGYPDLMAVRDDTLYFFEVKAPGDTLRRNQLVRLQQLMSSGFHVDILKAEYRFDPEQDYVVVDIETTGGRRGGHRITEIAAFKVRENKIVDKWHSLINPCRSIPAKIVSLNGITDDLVKHAPRFEDIADELLCFMENSVFVAHSVNFDYGFISHEYERLGIRFQFPKFCTCANMRRYYPGNKSYSLKSLSEVYNIPLESHHRACDDAAAAVTLLTMINEKRGGVKHLQDETLVHGGIKKARSL